MRNPIHVLKSLEEKASVSNYKYERLYRNLYNPVNSRQAHVVQCLPVHPLCHASLRFRNVRISKEIELWII